MSGRKYSLRSSPAQRRVATTTSTSTTSTSYSATTSVSSSSNGERTLTPAPVQRTLRLEEADDEDDEEEEEEVVQQFVHGDDADDDVEEVHEFDAFGRGRLVHEDDDEAETDDEDEATPTGRSFTRPRQASAARREGVFGALRRRAANSAFVTKLNRSRHVRQATAAVRDFWFVVRNFFMTFNFVWLLLPLGCFLIAILVPHYLTTAIRYVDILTTSSAGVQANLAYEKGMMRSVVQEIVDVKLSAMQEEITSLRNTIVTQEREFEGLRLLHESFRQVHEDTQKKLSVVDSNSILSIHIEHVVSKHAETLWKRFQDKSAKLEETVRALSNQQHELMETVTHHQDDILQLRTAGSSSSSSNKPPSMSMANERAFKEELFKWKAALQEELHMTLEREVVDVEDRMHKSLLAEKQVLVDNVKTLHTLDAANPALISMIESAVVKVDKQKAGAPDYAALANGGMVVRHESDLLDSKSRSPLELLESLFGFPAGDSPFTSTSFRSSPILKISSLFLPHDIPWWLSRHNARPETALSETKEIGSCWGLTGSTGRLTVKFARRIFADSVTIDHIPEEIATDFSTAPKSFRVLGVAADRSRDVVEFLPFGNFTYERDGAASQTFRLTSSLRQRIAIDGATLEIASNHGHPDYTCLYRFQVHGTPAP